MAIIPSAASPQAALRATVTESIEDPVSAERMTKAVTVVPCGHIFNEDTVIQCLARNKLCPLDRTPIERYVPNYNMRRLAETADVDSKEDEGPNEEAKAHFLKGKELSEKGDYEAAIIVFLEALQLSPTYEKAQAYLDFCLKRTSEPSPAPKSLPMNLSSSVKVESPKTEKASPGEISKERYTDLLLNLLEEPQIKSNSNLCKTLGEQVEELMNQEAEELTPQQKESFKWIEKLFVDNKVRQFVADKLQQIHVKNSPQAERLPAHLPIPAAAIKGPSILSFSLVAPSSPAKFTNLSEQPSSPAIAPIVGQAKPASQVALAKSVAQAKPAPRVVLSFEVKPPALPSIAFGKEMWEKYLGDIGAEPSLPPDINAILKGPCPFWPDKKIEETHVLVLIPQTVNGKPLTLRSLEELVQHPRQREATQYAYLDLGRYTDPPAPPAHWVLMTKDVLPGSRSKSYRDQQTLIHSYRQKALYEVPSVLDATVCIFMEYFRSRTYLYEKGNPWTYTRCQEKYDTNWQLAVGGFAPGGLYVYSDSTASEYGNYGVGALRKFPAIGPWKRALVFVLLGFFILSAGV